MKHNYHIAVVLAQDEIREEELRKQFNVIGSVICPYSGPHNGGIDYAAVEKLVHENGANLIVYAPRITSDPNTSDRCGMYRMAIEDGVTDLRALAKAFFRQDRPNLAHAFRSVPPIAQQLRWMAIRRNCELGVLERREDEMRRP